MKLKEILSMETKELILKANRMTEPQPLTIPLQGDRFVVVLIIL